MSGVRLTELLSTLSEELRPVAYPERIGEVYVDGLTQDSRQVTPGMLFAAIPGAVHSGEDHIDAVIGAGAIAILCRESARERIPDHYQGIVLTVPEPRRVLSHLAAAYYRPQPPGMVAVTGTDGKTSTAEFIRQLWELLGHKALSIGTMGLVSDTVLRDMPALSENTSPETVTFFQSLACACEQGIYYAVCEASSHGLSQYRMDGVSLKATVFTSFSQDHLDYHGTMDAYFAAKARLFKELLDDDHPAILCQDYPEIAALAGELRARRRQVITYGTQGDMAIRSVTPIPSGQHVVLMYEDEEYEMNLPVFGAFQVYNICAAMLAVAATTRTHPAELVAFCSRLSTIRGRLELVGKTQEGALIFIDYAHTPGALEKALSTLRPYAGHQLHAVFGCGGDRDRDKRPKMGRVAAELTDAVIITDDNPRTEDPDVIRAEILVGCPGAKNIADRREAIDEAIRGLQAGDVLLIAGKGHENYQIIGTTKYHSDDAEIVADILGEMILHA